MPFRRLLVGVGDLEQGLFAEVWGHELQPDGQAVRKAAGERDRRDAGHVGGDGQDVVKLHCQRVGDLAELEGDRGSGRGDDGVVLFESKVKIAFDEGANFLSRSEERRVGKECW